jgi:hypothetical protein
VSLIARLADLAPAAPLLVPVHTDAISDFEVNDTRTQLNDFAHRLVPGHDGQGQAKRAVMDVQIRSAHAACMNLDNDLAGGRARVGKGLHFPIGVVFGDNGCSHGVLLVPLRLENATMVYGFRMGQLSASRRDGEPM